MASEIMAILATLILEYRMTLQSNIGNVTISALDIEYTVIPNIDTYHPYSAQITGQTESAHLWQYRKNKQKTHTYCMVP